MEPSMHATIIAFGLGLTLATPAMADMRVEQGVRVHRGPATPIADDKAEAGRHPVRMRPAPPVAVRRTVVLDRRYGSAATGWRLARP